MTVISKFCCQSSAEQMALQGCHGYGKIMEFLGKGKGLWKLNKGKYLYL